MNKDTITQADADDLSTRPKLEFINLTEADVQETSDETRKRVRRHAQAHYRRTLGKKRQTTIELDTSALLDSSTAYGLGQASAVGLQCPAALTPGPSTLLDRGRVDPFASFNIGDSQRAHRLWDHGIFQVLSIPRTCISF